MANTKFALLIKPGINTIIPILFGILSSMNIYGGDVNFISSFQTAKKLAIEQNKLIFVDVMADWCGPCKKMMADLRMNNAACDFFNENYINLKINEKYNLTFLNDFNIKSFPTILFMSGSGTIIESIVGYSGIPHILSVAKKLHMEKDKYQTFDVSEDDENFNEERFVKNFSKSLIKLNTNFRSKNIQKYLDAGEPYTSVVLKHFGSMISYPLFRKYYTKNNYKEAEIAEQLLISYLMHESNFNSNEKIRKESKELSKLTGLSQSKVNSFMIAYKEFAIMLQLGMTSEQNLAIYAKSLLTYYPETKDVNLLYDAMVTVIKNEKANTFYSQLQPDIEKLCAEKKHFIYPDFLSVIYAKQGLKEDAAREVAEASRIAESMNFRFVPLLSQFRNEILE